MNGYTSANAAITVDGHKKTLPAALARGVFIDLGSVGGGAPRMIRAGLGDRSVARRRKWIGCSRTICRGRRTARRRSRSSPDEPALLGRRSAARATAVRGALRARWCSGSA
jgi:hypothetical protein